ncbi:hypothetical protein J3454_14345 [Erythrobacter sp. NFXS35]|uniref:phage head-tail joining protein n=1 Tax=Erythrobacter sp. NFXS35 TaxID=2818436 RepID=UPI0032DEA197
MWTQDDLDRVQAALASGQKSVTFEDGRKLEYQDGDDLLKLRTQIKAELAANDPVRPVRRATVARMGRRR